MNAALAAAQDAGFAYTDAWMLDDTSQRIYRRTMFAPTEPPVVPTDPNEFLRHLLRGNFVFTSTTVRKSVLEQVGGYKGSLSPAEDYELWLRIAAHGYRGVRVPTLVAVHRFWSGSLSSDYIFLAGRQVDVYNEILETCPLPPPLQDLTIKRLRESEARVAALRAQRPKSKLRTTLGAWKRALLWRRTWYTKPPADLQRVLAPLDDGLLATPTSGD